MSDAQNIQMQPQAREQMMVAQNQPTPAQLENGAEAQKKPTLAMRGGGLLLDLCACFICCEACDACCRACDDCCCC